VLVSALCEASTNAVCWIDLAKWLQYRIQVCFTDSELLDIVDLSNTLLSYDTFAEK